MNLLLVNEALYPDNPMIVTKQMTVSRIMNGKYVEKAIERYSSLNDEGNKDAYSVVNELPIHKPKQKISIDPITPSIIFPTCSLRKVKLRFM